MSYDSMIANYNKHYLNHILYVMLAWKAIRVGLWDRQVMTLEEFDKTTKLICVHDESKMTKEEWTPYAEKFFGDNKDDPEVKAKFKAAVKVHKERNKHHYESLKEYKGDDWKCYILELVCDYIAMGWEFDSYVIEYYDLVKDKIDLPEEYKNYLDSIINILGDPQFHTIEEPMTPEKREKLFWQEDELDDHNGEFAKNPYVFPTNY